MTRVDRNLGRRLREARREIGLTTREVCKKLPSRLAVSHTTLTSYENGMTVPPVTVLAALADIYGRTLTWFLENRDSLSTFRYINIGSRVPLREQRQFEAVACKWADAYLNLRQHLKVSASCVSGVPGLGQRARLPGGIGCSGSEGHPRP